MQVLPKRGFAWLAVALVLVVVLCLVAFSGAQPRYQSISVDQDSVAATVNASGTLQPHKYVDVGAQVSGMITQLLVQPGDQVQQGQLLVEIDPSVQQAVVDAGRASIASLEAQLLEQQAEQKLARLNYQRQLKMHKVQATRDEDLQTAEAELAKVQARIKSLTAQIQQNQASQRAEEARLGYTRIYAPMSGTVVAVDAREGQTLNATYQTPNILRIADLNNMTVWTDVSEADISRVKADMQVSFTTLGNLDDQSRSWHSRVRQVLPAPPTPLNTDNQAASTKNNKGITYTVLFDIDNSDHQLLPQMTAQVTFHVAQADNVLVLPLSVIKRTEQGYQVQVLAEGKAQTRAVKLGVRNRHKAQIISGVMDGEQVIEREIAPRNTWSWITW